MTASASSPVLNIVNFNHEDQFECNYPNSCQNTKSIKSEFEQKENKEIDLLYHFETFRNTNMNQSSSHHTRESHNTREPSTGYNSRFKSNNFDSSRNSQTRMNSFETKRQEVLKRRDQIEKQRIDRITQKIKEKDQKISNS